jgi:uncharacterized membrane protein (DUF4010 family)
MTPLEIAARFGVASGLGFVLGLERERSQVGEKAFAGARTLSLIALIGAVSSYLQTEYPQAWILPVAFLSVTALVVISYRVTTRDGHVGATTEVSAIVTFLVGCLAGWGHLGTAAGVGVGVLLLLSIKAWSKGVVRRIETADVEALLKFAVITIIVLPLLPNRAFGPPPLNVLNPYKIWLMVVLISGLNFLSYILVKVVGQEQGVGITGLLGGLVSSTAVTLGFSQRSRQEPELAPSLARGILLAWTVMFLRVLIMVSLVCLPLGKRLGTAIGLMAAVSLALCGLTFLRGSAGARETAKSGSNPFELSEAVKFGLLFGAVTLAAKAAQVYLGAAGLYLAGALAGLTDVDAISLSMAEMSRTAQESVGPAAVTVLIAVLSNTVVKAGMALGMGSPELKRRMLPATVLLLAAGAGAAFLVR